MNDVEILFCTYLGATDELLALLADIIDHEATDRAAKLERAVALAWAEHATRKARWTPVYDAVVRDIRDSAATFWRCITGESEWDDHGHEYWPRDRVYIMRSELALHARLVAQLEQGGRTLADAWERCPDLETALPLLRLSPADPRELLRGALVEALRSPHSSPRRAAIEDILDPGASLETLAAAARSMNLDLENPFSANAAW
jgi:hypothetical protein